MGAGWEQYGKPAGYTQQQWNSLPQARRDAVKLNAANAPYNQAVAESYGYQSPGHLIYGIGGPTADDGPTYTQSAPSGGGGGYLAYEPPPPKLLAESPEWLAYLNALGLEENMFRADIDRQRGLYEAENQRQLVDLPVPYIEARRNITGSLENRGMARSGELLRRLAENRASQGRAAGALNAQLGIQKGNLESTLAQKLIDIGAKKAQMELQLRGQGYV